MAKKMYPTVAITWKALAAARIAVGTGVVFLVLFAALLLLKRDLDPSWTFISAYALGPYGWVMTIAFLALAASCASAFASVVSQIPTSLGKAGACFLLVGSLGYLLAGIFSTDSMEASSMSLAGTIHSLGAVLADGVALSSLFVTVSLIRRNPAWRSSRVFLIVGVLLTWSSAILFTVSLSLLAPDGQFGPDVKIGWQGRYLMVAYAAWPTILGWRTLKAR